MPSYFRRVVHKQLSGHSHELWALHSLVCMQQPVNSVGREVLPLHGTGQQQIGSDALGKAVKIIWDRLDVTVFFIASQ